MTDSATLRQAILDRVAALRAGTTCCPSEIARALAKDWRPLMDDVRAAAAELCDQGEITVTQGGEPVDARTAKGPIRLGLPAA
ncbi:DUF3253 domain-containing protein [Paracoccus sp. TK19116]|uniref:DUF3253 domain-containing protein n=1 Tax=Paracoccus albicereus TaxID=2922394 RepID=A0ABT1MP68_9RHOB|nr:DUF3253 domain-containing protein [Paracoccus albicereus]MCQ0970077.1 DUF3253 domain-containing protein [Paracoccus albicereus]